MAEETEGPCRWCGEALPPKAKPGGRRREFCNTECRNRLHGEVRWHEAQRRRLEAELERRRLAVETAPDRAHALRWVEALEGHIARVDGEIAALG